MRPQGGGPRRVDDRAVFTAIVFVLTSVCAWRQLPSSFGVSVRHMGGSRSGPGRTCGGVCIGRCWMSWVPAARLTGSGQWWMAHRSERKRRRDRTEPR
ncbi:transposase [Saccharomonospora xinjiangensis]|uniref:transposase n=1 Tax=Saccharomonospora xinjiangensis TaxID=75294 RepID=UPI0018DEDE58